MYSKGNAYVELCFVKWLVFRWENTLCLQLSYLGWMTAPSIMPCSQRRRRRTNTDVAHNTNYGSCSFHAPGQGPSTTHKSSTQRLCEKGLFILMSTVMSPHCCICHGASCFLTGSGYQTHHRSLLCICLGSGPQTFFFY